MRAVITGATSGIGKEMAYVLNKMGYKLTLIARRRDRLLRLKEELGDDTVIITADLSEKDEVMRAYEEAKADDIEILINNAGFGLCGSFTDTSLERETKMTATNDTAVLMLTKLFLRDFEEKNRGYILNVASVAAFLPGPLLAVYYASKAYVRVLTESIYGELSAKGSNVYIGLLCPGPVKTEFDDVANVSFSLKGKDASYVAGYAIDKMFKRRLYIFPGLSIRAAAFFSRFVPMKILVRITYRMQKRKIC